MKPIEYQSSSGVVFNVPKVISSLSVINKDDTVLSDEFQTNGALISLPPGTTGIIGPIDSIKIPPCPHSTIDGLIVLDDVAVKVNNLLRVIRLYEKGEKEITHVSKSLVALQTFIIGNITQKSGILNQFILGTRMPNTLRGVLVPYNGPARHHAMFPLKAKKVLEINEDDCIVIGRDPVIWDGSIEVVTAKFWNRNTIGLNPVIYKQLGADSDGDTVWAIAIDQAAQEKVKSKILSFNPDVPYREFTTDGFSVSPMDIVQNSKNCEEFTNRTGKNVQEEAFAIANTVSKEDFNNYLVTINRALLVQKKLLGPAGAVSNKLKLIGTTNPILLKSANIISERLQQVLFDYKGVINSSNDAVNIFDMYDLVSMKGVYKTTFDHMVGHTEVISRLEKYGVNKEDAYPIISYVYSVYPFILLLGPKYKDALIALCDPANADQFRNKLNSIIESSGTTFQNLISDYLQLKRSLSIGSILNDPIYNLVNQTSSIANNTIEELGILKQIISTDFTTGLFTSSIVKQVHANV